MNTFPDQMELERAIQLMREMQPSWKLDLLPRDPQTNIFTDPTPPRRALFDMGSVFSQDVGNQGGGSTPPVQLSTFQAYAGVFENGVPVQRLVSVYGTVA